MSKHSDVANTVATLDGRKPISDLLDAAPLFSTEYGDLLLSLLHLSTANPLEGSVENRIVEAQRCYADCASRVGFEVVLHEPAPVQSLLEPLVPLSVKEASAQTGYEAFLAAQPNMVLRLGSARDSSRTLMLNFHMDTVGGYVPVGFRDGRFTGRGSVDMKGPGVAILAGIKGALRCHPKLAEDLTVILQCVSGEEGGAMGVYGSRVLAQQGYLGRLNVFAEPSEGRYFDSSTTSMTACVRMDGDGSTDDEPQAGHNASLLLGYVAQHLGKNLAGLIDRMGGKLCIAGLRTGDMHNRVYGSGELLLNIAYPDLKTAEALRCATETSVEEACELFSAEFRRVRIARKTAREASAVCNVSWLKQGLPVLSNHDTELGMLLSRSGLVPRVAPGFTCDAMWAQGPGMYTVVCGPGSLADNGAHSESEFVELSCLESYSRALASLVVGFCSYIRTKGRGEDRR